MELISINYQTGIDKRDNSEITIETFEIGNYQVIKQTSVSKGVNKKYIYYHYSVTRNSGIQFLPPIYRETHFDDNDVITGKFVIQTTSYGTLETDEIEQMIDLYKEAIEVVNILNKTFGEIDNRVETL